MEVQPVEVTGNLIARSFWGRRWCRHLESFSDYRNRLPRGRSYVRHGAVCDLAIQACRIDALVFGTGLYRVTIGIRKLRAATWETVKARCTGQIGSVLELLQGQLSDHVMDVVTDRDRGLFPTPRQIELDCDCPDWASMCKHVAAVLYGVGNRLDESPELLFLLRNIDVAELIDADMTLPAGSAQEDSLAEADLSDIFGIELDTDEAQTVGPGGSAPVADDEDAASKHPAPKPRQGRARKTRRARRTGKTRQARKAAGARASPDASLSAAPQRRARKKDVAKSHRATRGPASKGPAKKAPRDKPFRPTGADVSRLRRRTGLSVAQFARTLRVSPTTVHRWEAVHGPLNLQTASHNALRTLHEQSSKTPSSKEVMSKMSRRKGRYPAEYRQRMVDLVRSGRSPEQLAREFEASAQSIRNWIAQANRDEGRQPPKR